MSNEIARKSYQDLVNDPDTNLDLLDKIEEQLIVMGETLPLSNSTPPAEWDAYWQRIADAYQFGGRGVIQAKLDALLED